jgi:hypothetical protein
MSIRDGEPCKHIPTQLCSATSHIHLYLGITNMALATKTVAPHEPPPHVNTHTRLLILSKLVLPFMLLTQPPKVIPHFRFSPVIDGRTSRFPRHGRHDFTPRMFLSNNDCASYNRLLGNPGPTHRALCAVPLSPCGVQSRHLFACSEPVLALSLGLGSPWM